MERGHASCSFPIFSLPAGANEQESIIINDDEEKQRKKLWLRSFLPLLVAALPVLLLTLGTGDQAIAIDHPVDFRSLNIPNPIPDADPRYFISGGVCAAASHGFTTPIDVGKQLEMI